MGLSYFFPLNIFPAVFVWKSIRIKQYIRFLFILFILLLLPIGKLEKKTLQQIKHLSIINPHIIKRELDGTFM